MSDVSNLIRDKMDQAEEGGRAVVRSMQGMEPTENTHELFFKAAFPNLDPLRTNLATGEFLANQILFTPPVIFDLKPIRRDQFDGHFKMSPEDALLMVRSGLAIGNIYSRNPEDWVARNITEDYEYLRPLLKAAVPFGVYADKYLEWKSPRAKSFAAQELPQLRDSMSVALRTDTNAIKALLQREPNIAVEANPDKIPGIVATVLSKRFGYLFGVDQSLYDYVLELWNSGKYVEAQRFSRVAKHFFASPITAAMGGVYTWSGSSIASISAEDVERIRATSKAGVLKSVPDKSKWEERAAARQHTLAALMKLPEFKLPDGVPPALLREFAQSEKGREIARNLYRITGEVARRVDRGHAFEDQINELGALQIEYQAWLRKADRRTQLALSICLGVMVKGAIEYAGEVVGVFSGQASAISVVPDADTHEPAEAHQSGGIAGIAAEKSVETPLDHKINTSLKGKIVDRLTPDRHLIFSRLSKIRRVE